MEPAWILIYRVTFFLKFDTENKITLYIEEDVSMNNNKIGTPDMTTEIEDLILYYPNVFTKKLDKH